MSFFFEKLYNRVFQQAGPFSTRSASARFRMNDLLRLAHFSKLIHSDNPFCKTASEYLPFP